MGKAKENLDHQCHVGFGSDKMVVGSVRIEITAINAKRIARI